MNNIDKLLTQLRALEKDITAAPWYAHNPDDCMSMNVYCITSSEREPDVDLEPEQFCKDIIALTLFQNPRLVDHADGRWEANTYGIAAMRNTLPVLLAMLAEAQDALERMSVATSEPERFNAEANATLAKLDALAALDSATPPERADFLAACGRVGEAIRTKL